MDERSTVYIVDDDLAVRESLEVLVRAMELHVVCYGSAEEFLASYDRTWPGCLVLDLRMPGMSGFDLQEKLLSEEIDLPIIFMTGHGDVPMSVRAMKQGAIDFLEKPYKPQHMRSTIEQAIQQDTSRRKEQSHRNEAQKLIASLTEEERAVMEGIVAGKPNKIIASELGVSLRTVQFRRSRMMQKLGVDSKAALVQLVFTAR